MYLHFDSRVQLTGEPKCGGERHRHNSGPFHKKRQAKTPVSRRGKLASSSFLLQLPINRQDNTGGGAERAAAQASFFDELHIAALTAAPPWAAVRAYRRYSFVEGIRNGGLDVLKTAAVP